MWKKVDRPSPENDEEVWWFDFFSHKSKTLYLSSTMLSRSTGSPVGLYPLKNCLCEQHICSLACNKFFTGLNVSPLVIQRFIPPQDKAHGSLLLVLPRTEASIVRPKRLNTCTEEQDPPSISCFTSYLNISILQYLEGDLICLFFMS